MGRISILFQQPASSARTFLEDAHGYLWLFMTALDRLPRATGRVYRGISKDKVAQALELFKVGKRVHFTAPSSTTPVFGVAKSFAGVDGIVCVRVCASVSVW